MRNFKKKILVIGYSQSGQLSEILNKFLIPFTEEDIETINIKPEKPFPFPWTGKEFFDSMPESVLEREVPLLPIPFKSQKYDLIVFGYQPWYLSPSIPATSILKNRKFLDRLKDTPIVTIIGARNMWLNAQERIKKRINDAGGILRANIPFVDRNTNLISVVTIVYWMMTGKKDRFLKIFPKPGISSEDIDHASEYGTIVHGALLNNSFTNLQEQILSLGLIEIKTNLMFIESRAKTIFQLWAKKIIANSSNKRRRAILVQIFKYYLFTALFLVSPIVLLFYSITIPFTTKAINRKKNYYYNI